MANLNEAKCDAAIARYEAAYGKEPTVRELRDFLRAERQLALEAAKEREKADRGIYVRVRFTNYGKLYAYRCPGAKVGDWVVVPPSGYCSTPQLLKVVELGRGCFTGEPRRAHRVPRKIARGDV